jgi:heme oxygenase (biliverdin-IX-beta and delta-forming)
MALAPLEEATPARRPSAAEQARTIMAGTNVASLASLTREGDPWASMVTFGLVGGVPVLCLSDLALHGRNLKGDQRGSLAVAVPVPEETDPSDSGRVTLAGTFEEPREDEAAAARAAYNGAVEGAEVFSAFADFTFWVMRIETVRWVGGFGRMASADPESYLAAEADPVSPHASFAVSHLNEDHADALLAMARAIAGHTDATSARCLRADRYGLDLGVNTPRGDTPARVAFAEPLDAPGGLRPATVELARRARSAAG